MSLSEDSLEVISVAILAVYQYPVEKAWKLLQSLRDEGLTVPALTADADIGDVTVRLARAGYDRGLLTEMFAQRIRNLAVAARDGLLDELDGLVATRDKANALALLVRVKGIGPKVAETAWMLLSDES